MIQTSYQIASAAVSDRGLSEKRPQNEDSFLELPAMGLFVVADGVGGAQAGEVASQTAVEVLSEAFSNVQSNVDVEDLMEIAIQRANSAIYQMSQDVTRLSSMATTIVALQLSNNIATIGHVGDSRLYRLDSKGNLFRETHDHSVVEEEVRAGRLTPAQAANHPSRNVISRALGADDHVEVDMKTIMFEPGSTFLLCSDGITRHVTDPELREVLTSKTPELACAELKNLCYSRGAEDNLTAVVIKAVSTSAENGFDNEDTISNIRPALMDDDPPPLEIEDSHLSPPSPPPPVSNEGAIYRMDGIPGPAPEKPGQLPEQLLEKMKTEHDESVRAAKRGSIFKNLVSSFFLILCGAGLGALGYYAWSSRNPAPAQINVPVQNPPVPYSAFEEERRVVDRNAAAYLQTHADKAVTAEDHYLIGRSLLQEKKYIEAIAALEKAKGSLNLSSEGNRRTLEIEIAQAMAVALSREAQAGFEKEKPAAAANTNTNSNAR
jgi:protein phosphatase